jgi:hypothetical protein
MVRCSVIPAILLGALTCLPPGATATQIHVPADYPAIQAAIDAAQDGDVIIVSPGRYPEHITFLGKAITVRSTDPEDADVVAATIVDGGGDGRCVTFDSGEGPGSVLAGLTIANGFVSGQRPGGCGAGIYCTESSPTIRNNLITGNTATYGGGIWCDWSSPALIDNAITANTAYGGGGVNCSHCSGTITGNVITENTADGSGGVSSWHAAMTIAGNTIAANSASWDGGIACSDNGVDLLVIVGNTIVDNGGCGIATGDYGTCTVILLNSIAHNRRFGIDYAGSRPAIVTNTITQNYTGIGSLCGGSPSIINNIITANESRGIRGNFVSSAFVANCTIVGNPCGVGFYYSQGGPLTICNSIVWSNPRGTGQVGVHGHASLTIAHSLIEGGRDGVSGSEAVTLTWGEGNVDADPRFVYPGYWHDSGTPSDFSDDVYFPGDYRLLPGSPCIDGGTNDIDNPHTEQIEELPETDMAAMPRIVDGDGDGVAAVDIGACEYRHGDVNFDGRVNILDLIFVRNYLGADPASDAAVLPADLNADGKVNVLDLIAARKEIGSR